MLVYQTMSLHFDAPLTVSCEEHGKSGCCAWPQPQLLRRGADSEKSVTAAQVNGTWKTKYGEFKIWALGQTATSDRIFGRLLNTKRRRGPTANEGEGSGVATIDGDTAIFKPEGAEEECQITLKFTRGKLVVTTNRHLRIRPQRDRSRHLQKAFR